MKLHALPQWQGRRGLRLSGSPAGDSESLARSRCQVPPLDIVLHSGYRPLRADRGSLLAGVACPQWEPLGAAATRHRRGRILADVPNKAGICRIHIGGTRPSQCARVWQPLRPLSGSPLSRAHPPMTLRAGQTRLQISLFKFSRSGHRSVAREVDVLLFRVPVRPVCARCHRNKRNLRAVQKSLALA